MDHFALFLSHICDETGAVIGGLLCSTLSRDALYPDLEISYRSWTSVPKIRSKRAALLLGVVLWPPSSIRIVDWNIDRGLQLSGVIEFLADSKADLLLLQEVDMHAKRTHRLNVAREIAQKLR